MCELIYTLRRSNRCPGRFALDCPDGPVIGYGRAVYLRRGRTWLDGVIEGRWFVPDTGAVWCWEHRIKLRAGMKIWI